MNGPECVRTHTRSRRPSARAKAKRARAKEREREARTGWEEAATWTAARFFVLEGWPAASSRRAAVRETSPSPSPSRATVPDTVPGTVPSRSPRTTMVARPASRWATNRTLLPPVTRTRRPWPRQATPTRPSRARPTVTLSSRAPPCSSPIPRSSRGTTQPRQTSWQSLLRTTRE